jgi:hypothetical protein
MIDAASSLVDVAFHVCTHLANRGITAVLTGGSAATYYAPDAYQSKDIDFVLEFALTTKAVATAMADAGFSRSGSVYSCPDTILTVDLIEGPIAVGSEIISDYVRVEDKRGVLLTISATDSVRDRLAAFIHWNDRNSLDQAVAVARNNKIDLVVVEAWCRAEGGAQKFEAFKRLLGGQGGTRTLTP